MTNTKDDYRRELNADRLGRPNFGAAEAPPPARRCIDCGDTEADMIFYPTEGWACDPCSNGTPEPKGPGECVEGW